MTTMGVYPPSGSGYLGVGSGVHPISAPARVRHSFPMTALSPDRHPTFTSAKPDARIEPIGSSAMNQETRTRSGA